jgi:hypothetical protein
MTDPMELLRKVTSDFGQAAVARETGYSASAINQALKGSYSGKLDNLLQKVAETYGNGTVECPVLGMITLKRCASERRKPFAASSPVRVKLWRTCKKCREYQRQNPPALPFEKGEPEGI